MHALGSPGVTVQPQRSPCQRSAVTEATLAYLLERYITRREAVLGLSDSPRRRRRCGLLFACSNASAPRGRNCRFGCGVVHFLRNCQDSVDESRNRVPDCILRHAKHSYAVSTGRFLYIVVAFKSGTILARHIGHSAPFTLDIR